MRPVATIKSNSYKYSLRPKLHVHILKTTNNQIKMASDKIYTQKINRHIFGTKYGNFPQCDLAKS